MSVNQLIEGGSLGTPVAINSYNVSTDFLVSFDAEILKSNINRQDAPYCESEVFFCDTSFKVRCYPNGFATEAKHKILRAAVYVSDVCTKINVTINLFAILNNHSKMSHVIIDEKISLIKGGCRYIAGEDWYQSNQHLANNEKSSYISNDGKFQFKLSLSTHSDQVVSSQINWATTVNERLFHKATSDVDIVVEGTRIPAHKLILSFASPVFTAMFENQMQESVSNEVVISDFSEEVVRSMLRCIYDCDAVKSEVERNPEQLLCIAHKYALDVIEVSAVKHIVASITHDNVIDVLQTADKFDRPVIKSAAMNYIVKNADYFFVLPNIITTVGSELASELLGFMVTNKRVKY